MINTQKHHTPDGSTHQSINESQLNPQRLLNDEPLTHQNLEESIKHYLEKTPLPGAKLRTNIVQILLSHSHIDVQVYSMARIYSLVREELLQELIIEYLTEMCNHPQLRVREAAQESLEIIASQVYHIMIAEMIPEVFQELERDIRAESQHLHLKHSKKSLLSLIPSYPFHSNEISKNRFTFRLVKLYRQFNFWLDKTLFSDQLEELFPPLEDIEYLFMADFPQEIIHPSPGYDSPWKPTDSLESLARIYAHTFMENGHLHRLEHYLDDEDWHVRKIGVDAMITVLEFLLNSPLETEENVNHHLGSHWRFNLKLPAKLQKYSSLF